MNEPPNIKKILIVDDVAGNILVARTLVEEFGYEYDTALSGAEALAKFKTGKYCAVLLDVQMPDMDGFEVAKLIRTYEEEEKLHRISIIGLTAYALAGNREQCIKAGMDDYISKPYTAENLKKVLGVYCAQERKD